MGGNIAAINVLVGATGPRDIMDRMGIVGQVMQKQQESVDEMTVGPAGGADRTGQRRPGQARRRGHRADRRRQAHRSARSAQVAAVQARAAVVELADSRRAALAVGPIAAQPRCWPSTRRPGPRRRGSSPRCGPGTTKGGSGPVSTYGGGRLLMPVHGWKSSDFGNRYDPYYRVWQLHAGMDLAADGGTPIHAAADGRVIRAGYNGGYGNYTCISHGRLSGAGLLHLLRPPVPDRRVTSGSTSGAAR